MGYWWRKKNCKKWRWNS